MITEVVFEFMIMDDGKSSTLHHSLYGALLLY